jgi:DNA-binding HxlR family transcriptional regulator
MALLDLLGRRWALRVLYELRDGPLGFRELQERCDSMSTSVLSQRLGELEEAGIVEPARDGGYTLTTEGTRLLGPLAELDRWSRRWAYR